jgi:hypothetical protein
MPVSGPAGKAPARGRSIGLRLLLFTFAVFALGVGGFALFAWSALHYVYSDGERAGYVQKFSRRGWVCKTWEGELAMVNLPGTMPQIFAFSVRDPKVADTLNQTMGQRVAIHYEQHNGIPTDCFGETEYFVTQVRALEGQPSTAPPATLQPRPALPAAPSPAPAPPPH